MEAAEVTWVVYTPVDNNLVARPSFETSTTGWVDFGTNVFERTTERALAGAHSLKVTYGDDLRLAEYPLNLPGSSDVWLVAWVFIPSDWDGGSLTIGDDGTYAGATYRDLDWRESETVDEWVPLALKLRPDADLSGGIYIRTTSAPSAGKSIYIDAVSAIVSTADTPPSVLIKHPSPTALDLYASLGAYTVGDEALGWPLLKVCRAIATVFTEPIAELVAERDGRLPWEVLFDPALCPAAYLPYLAQFVGVTLTSGMTEAEQRAAIVLPEGFRRGTADAIQQAIQRTLIGNKHVAFLEREGGAYQLGVRTQIAETPDEAATLAAILAQKPIGIVLDYDAIVGATLAEVDAAYPTLQAVDDDNENLAEVLLL